MSVDKRTIKPERPHIEHINENKIAHMVGVAEWMRERAEDYGLNPDVMYAIGLLHDVGYLQGRVGHEKRGGEILSAIGVDEDVRFAIAHHGENLRALQKEPCVCLGLTMWREFTLPPAQILLSTPGVSPY